MLPVIRADWCRNVSDIPGLLLAQYVKHDYIDQQSSHTPSKAVIQQLSYTIGIWVSL